MEENENVSLHHGVDATNIPQDILDDKKPNVAVFNFPCVPGENSQQDGQLSEIDTNKKMLDQMFGRIKTLQISEVHISHKCKGSFNSWNIPERCQNSGLKFQYAMAFDKELYPDYTNKKVHTSQGSFPCHDAKTYVFSDENKNKDYEYESENVKALEKLLEVTKQTIQRKKSKKK